jgi:hypothetical protein
MQQVREVAVIGGWHFFACDRDALSLESDAVDYRLRRRLANNTLR